MTDGMAVLKQDKKSDVCEGYVYAKESLSIDNLEKWNDFVEIADVGTGSINYQISLNNGTDWLYWDGSQWSVAQDSNVNTSLELSEHIKDIDSSNNSLLVKAILSDSCEGDVKLLDMGISYDVKKLLISQKRLDSLTPDSGDQVLSSEGISLVDGVSSQAYEFDGTQGGYMVPYSESINPDIISLVIWAKPVESKTAILVDKGGWKSNYSIGQDKYNGWQSTLKINGVANTIEAGDSSLLMDS